MPQYTNAEMCEMLIIFGECHRNAHAAAREFRNRFPDSNHPTHATILRAVARVRQTGSTHDRPRAGRPMIVRNRVHDADILAYFIANPQSSTRAAAADCGLSPSQILRILHKHKFNPYHVFCSQDLHPGDELRRFDFCNYVLNHVDDDPDFLNKVLWSDEAKFTRDGTFNRHNSHYWAPANPRWTRSTHHQVQWSTNVWCGIYRNQIVGPFFYQRTLDGRRYLQLLQTSVTDFLDDLPLQQVLEMWFQHDGAPPHRFGPVGEWINNVFGQRCFGYGGITEWPPRSPDLNPLDYFLWGFLNTKVYATPPESLDDLQQRIVIACRSITADMLARTRDNMVTRLQACIVAEGGHIEYGLK